MRAVRYGGLLAAVFSAMSVGCSCPGGGCGWRGMLSGGLLEDIVTPGKYYLSDTGTGGASCPDGSCDVGQVATSGSSPAGLWTGYCADGQCGGVCADGSGMASPCADGTCGPYGDGVYDDGTGADGGSRPRILHRLAARTVGCSRAHCNKVGGGLAPGPTMGAVHYPYYTVRGPRDFFMKNPPSIGY